MSIQEKKNESNLKNLYLDRNKVNGIQIQIDNNTTIDTILEKHQDFLTTKVNILHNVTIEDCCFLIIETKINMKKDDIPSFMEFRLNKKNKIFKLLQNNQYNLYFLPKNKTSLERQKARNELNIIENCFENAETDYFLTKPAEEYLSKGTFYLYDNTKQILTKEKGSVDKNKITIFKNGNRDAIEIYIRDIIKDLYYSEIMNVPYKKNLPIKGDRPKFYIELQTNKQTYFFTFFKDNLYLQWESAIKRAITKYNNYKIELNLNININSAKTSLYATQHSIINSCFLINKTLFNELKRKIFLSNYPDKKIGAIFSNIIRYKDFIKRNEYLEAWMRFKEIITYIESYNIGNKKDDKKDDKKEDKKDDSNIINIQSDKVINIFTLEKFNKYKKVAEEIDEIVKKIKIEGSLYLFQNEIRNSLNNVIKEDLFDDIFFYLYNLYISPYFQEIKKILEKGSIPTEKPLIRQKYQFLLALYFNCINYMDMKNYYILKARINKDNELSRNESIAIQIL